MPDNSHSPQATDRHGIGQRSSRDSSSPARGAKSIPGYLEVRIALTASGMDLSGCTFLAKSHTELIMPSGCTVLLKQALAADDEIDVTVGNCEVHGRVAAKIRSLKEGHIYAIEFDPKAGNWDVAFPKSPEPAPTLLHCSACDLAGEVTFTGVDALVFEATGAITRLCPRCCERTRWKQKGDKQQGRNGAVPLPEMNPKESVAVLPLGGYIEPLQARSRTRDQRRTSRIQLKGAKACVETPVRGPDVVVVVNMSRGGLRFVSSKRYDRGDWMKVAAPYTPGGNNIFVPAEIVRIHKHPADGMPGEYALIFRST
jgi:hypothetical protein